MGLTKRDVLELRRRLTKKQCSFQRMSGCYMSGEREVILQFQESFVDLEDEEFFKYLEIAKKILSGTLGNNLLELEFDRTAQAGERRQFLLAVKESKLKNEALLSRFFEEVGSKYPFTGNMLILLFHDVYDVPVRTRDRQKLDESEEVFEYCICAICPVELSKPGLGYQEGAQRIGLRPRDWVVGLPEAGFLFPAFSDRSSDVNALLYYVKNAAETHPDFITDMLGCLPRRTAAEEKKLLKAIVEEAFDADESQADAVYIGIQRSLDGLMAEQEDDPAAAQPLTPAVAADLIAEVAMPPDARTKIERAYAEAFGETPPPVRHLLDPKLAQEGAQRAHTLALQQQITTLQQELAEQGGEQAPPWQETPPPDTAALQIPESRRDAVRIQLVEGRRCLLYPLADGETVLVNGAPLTE